MHLRAKLAAAACLAGAAGAPAASAQAAQWPEHVVVPQRRGLTLVAGLNAVAVESVDARVAIVDQVATTRLEIALRNPGGALAEAVLLLPVPDGAAVRSFDFQGSSEKPTARLLPADEARASYEAIVRRSRDPALLEFAGCRWIRSSVFPVPPRGAQRVSISYEEVLAADGDRVDYALPRSEAADAAPAPWRITATVQSGRPVSTLYSPSHAVRASKGDGTLTLVELEPGAETEPGSFLLSFVRASSGVSGSIVACPDPGGGGGHFLWLAGVPSGGSVDAGPPVPRELTVVIDRSGSMAGGKLDQAREAARQALEGLRAGERFNVMDYSDAVSFFAPSPVVKDAASMKAADAYLTGLLPAGGTNLHDALVAAVSQPAAPDALALVLFLTDGRATVGAIREPDIRNDVAAANDAERRIFTFGVGDDVNAPLLDAIAQKSRAWSAYVHPTETVEAKVGQLTRRLAEPVLTRPRIETIDRAGAVSTRCVRDVAPAELNDVFAGDQLVVLGRYLGDEPFVLRLTGERRGETRAYEFPFDPRRARPEHGYVARLWASRRIATLVDDVRQAGATGAAAHATALLSDPKVGETVSEIVRLSTRYGVLSEYTSFFATEGTDLAKPDLLKQRVANALAQRAQKVREGRQAVAQSVNLRRQRQQRELNRTNSYLDDELKRVRIANVAQVGDRTLYRRYAQWIDAEVFARAAGAASAPASAPAASSPATRVVDFGTPEYFALLQRLLAQGRQGLLALEGNLRLRVDGGTVIVRVN